LNSFANVLLPTRGEPNEIQHTGMSKRKLKSVAIIVAIAPNRECPVQITLPPVFFDIHSLT